MKYEIITPEPVPPPPTVVRLEVPPEAVRYLCRLVEEKTPEEDRRMGFSSSMTGDLYRMLERAEMDLPL